MNGCVTNVGFCAVDCADHAFYITASFVQLQVYRVGPRSSTTLCCCRAASKRALAKAPAAAASDIAKDEGLIELEDEDEDPPAAAAVVAAFGNKCATGAGALCTATGAGSNTYTGAAMVGAFFTAFGTKTGAAALLDAALGVGAPVFVPKAVAWGVVPLFFVDFGVLPCRLLYSAGGGTTTFFDVGSRGATLFSIALSGLFSPVIGGMFPAAAFSVNGGMFPAAAFAHRSTAGGLAVYFDFGTALDGAALLATVAGAEADALADVVDEFFALAPALSAAFAASAATSASVGRYHFVVRVALQK